MDRFTLKDPSKVQQTLAYIVTHSPNFYDYCPAIRVHITVFELSTLRPTGLETCRLDCRGASNGYGELKPMAVAVDFWKSAFDFLIFPSLSFAWSGVHPVCSSPAV